MAEFQISWHIYLKVTSVEFLNLFENLRYHTWRCRY